MESRLSFPIIPQIAKQKLNKLPNKNSTNCQMKTQQISKLKNKLLYISIKYSIFAKRNKWQNNNGKLSSKSCRFFA